MATSWAHEGAVPDQILDTIADGVEGAHSRLPRSEGPEDCAECREPIPPRRREALPGATTCLACQASRYRQVNHEMFNRRGSKDSQLR